MLRYTDTTVFNVDAQTIVNTVNCVGVMGAGLALEFQLRFPEMEKDYVDRCKDQKVEIGRPYLYKQYGNPWILNFPTKNHWKYPSKVEWIEQGLKYFAANYQKGGITSAAFPRLGCSRGGLEWNEVSPLMEKYLQELDIDIFICEDTEREASGTEAIMVQMLNNIESLSWCGELGIRSDIKRKIASATPIYRFRDLSKLEGIGKQTYNDVFRFLYSLANQTDNQDFLQKTELVNLNLFAQTNEYLNQPTQSILQINQPVEREEEKSDVSLEIIDLGTEQISSETQSLETIETNLSQPQYDNLFYVVLPSLEKALIVPQTTDEIAKGFKHPKKIVSSWLKEAEKLGKIKEIKIRSRPTKYIATSSVPVKQLECFAV
ncbi:MAG: macro domain-containing protein [Pseudanabaena sp.]|jgi:O-acetyl-ADP-ribose deacetylase (regulator of RNase III)